MSVTPPPQAPKAPPEPSCSAAKTADEAAQFLAWPRHAGNATNGHQLLLCTLGDHLRRMGLALEEYSRLAVLDEATVTAFSQYVQTIQSEKGDTARHLLPQEKQVLAKDPLAVVEPAPAGATLFALQLPPPGPSKVTEALPICSSMGVPATLPAACVQEVPAEMPSSTFRKKRQSGDAAKTKRAEIYVDFASPAKYSNATLEPYKRQFKRLAIASGMSGLDMSRLKKVSVTGDQFHHFFGRHLLDGNHVTLSEVLMLFRHLHARREAASTHVGAVTKASDSKVLKVDMQLDMFLELSLGEELDDYLPADVYAIAERVRAALSEEQKAFAPELADTDNHDSRPFQAGMSVKEVVSACVIMLNALVLALSADIQPGSSVWIVFEYSFTAFFTAEIGHTIWREGPRQALLLSTSWWNWFDLVVVVIALLDGFFAALFAGNSEVDLSQFAIIKMVRLVRLGRLVRLLRFRMFEELKMMVVGVFAGLRVLFWAIVLFFFFIFMMGMVMRMLTGNNEEFYVESSFGTVPWSMYTLFRCFTDGCSADDGTPLQVHLFKLHGAPFMIPYMLTFLFVTIGLFNLIMATFVENVMESTKIRRMESRQSEAARAARQLRNVLDTLANSTAGEHSSNTEVTRDVFLRWLGDAQFSKILEDLDIHMTNKLDMFDVLDANSDGQLTVDELTTGMMKLRGPAEKSDAIAAWLCGRAVQSQISEVEARLTRIIVSIAATSVDILRALDFDSSCASPPVPETQDEARVVEAM